MNDLNILFETLPVGKRFGLFKDSDIIYVKTGPNEARIVHHKEDFYIGLGLKEKIYPNNKAPL